MTSAPRFLISTALALLVLSGCRCGTQLNQRAPEISVRRDAIDFGLVELDFPHTAQLEITNTGTVNLNISELRIAEPFSVAAELPLSIGPDDTFSLPITFLPTRADVRETGTLVIVSDDAQRFETTVSLAGTGVKGVARVMPASLDFGEVYVGEPKTLMLTVTNAGSATLRTVDVAPPAIPTVTSDVAPLEAEIPAAGSATGSFTFTPTEMGDVSGELVITYPEEQGGPLTVPVTGRGIAALPQLCIESLETGVETCTPVTATTGNMQGNISLRLPAKCDIGLYPPGSGQTECSEDSATTRARLRVKNAGNTPFSYTLAFNADLNGNPCDLQELPPSDFQFSNAPMLADGGFARQWNEPSVSLPEMAGDPMPWERIASEIAYRATSRCPEDAADLASVYLTRQGPAGREPRLLTVVLTGQSRLPNLEPIQESCTANNSSCFLQMEGVENSGPAPASVLDVRMVEILPTDGGSSLCDAQLDAGTPIDCAMDGTDDFGHCARFRWALDGGSPISRLPIFVDAGSFETPTEADLGRIEFGFNGEGCGTSGGQVCPGQTYCIYAIVDSNDPWQPQVLVPIEGHVN